MSPILSVVCPFYKVEAYLAECLDSLRNQTLTDFEVIMVDDGSPDSCGQIAAAVAAADPRFTLITQKNAGLGPARNTGTAHATGRYLTFVDSDDVVPPRAYELMVSTLERTGSDFCAGNARRFGGELGPRQSWTHRNAFAANRLGTHISEFPQLVADRMVWNKVYRRSFWDEQGYEFPPIRYEDYPVTFPAHLAAARVDVLKAHIYYWRERDSNDSITQMTASIDNARDRVRSAHMVLDSINQDVDQLVAEGLNAYFVDVDIIALAGALAKGSAADKPELQHLLQGLARRLDPPTGSTQRLAALVHAAAVRGDFVVVEALATWRSTGDTKALATMLSRHLAPSQWNAIRQALVRPKKRPSVITAKALKAEVASITADADGFALTGRIKLRSQFAKVAKVRITLASTQQSRDLEATLTPRGHGFDVSMGVPFDLIAELAADHDGDASHALVDRCTIQIDIRVGPFRWQGQFKLPQDIVPPIAHTPAGDWVQASRRTHSPFLWFWTIANPVLVSAITAQGRDVTLEFSVPDGEAILAMPEPTPHWVYPIVDGRCTVDIKALVAGDPVDDPVTLTGKRQIKVRTAGHTHLPFLQVAAVEREIAGRVVRLGTSGVGHAQLSYLQVGYADEDDDA